jgi:hypothetical protein
VRLIHLVDGDKQGSPDLADTACRARGGSRSLLLNTTISAVRTRSGSSGAVHVLGLVVIDRTASMFRGRLDRVRIERRVLRRRRGRDVGQIRRTSIPVRGTTSMLNRPHAGIPWSGRGVVAKRADSIAAVRILGTVITSEIDDMFVLPSIGFVGATLFASQQKQDRGEQKERDGPADCTARDQTRTRFATSNLGQTGLQLHVVNNASANLFSSLPVAPLMAPEVGGATVSVVAGATGPNSAVLLLVVLAITRSMDEVPVRLVVVTELGVTEMALVAFTLTAFALTVLAAPAIVVTDVTDSAELL